MLKNIYLSLFKFSFIFLLLFYSSISLAINIKVVGNKFSDESAILSLIDKKPDNISQEYSNYLLKKLSDSGLFDNVEVKIENNEYIVTVIEYPSIKNLFFDKNKRLKDEDLLAIAKELNFNIFNNSNLDLFVSEVTNIYKSFGYNNIKIDIKSNVDVNDNSANLYFEITEGKITKINKVIFSGNKNIQNDLILSVIKSKNKSLLNLLANNNYKLFQVESDSVKIKNLYRTNGYKDIDVKFKIEYLKTNRVNIIFDIIEGDQYLFSSFKINNNLIGYDQNIQLAIDNFIIENNDFSGNKYDISSIEKLENNLANILENNGVPFFEINTFEKLINKDVEILFEIIPTKPKYINQINISGNTRTFENVIRREFRLSEGDTFNKSNLKIFKRNINKLNIFKSFEITENQISDELVNLNIEVEEKQTGTFNVGFSFGTLNGASFVTGLNEKNFGGTGRSVDFLIQTSDDKNQFTFNTTDRFFLNDEMNLKYGIIYQENDYSKSSSYNLNQLTIGSGLSYYFSKNLYHNLEINYKMKEYIVTDASTVNSAINKSSGQNVSFDLSNRLTYSTLNSFMRPSNGNFVEFNNIIETPSSSTNGLIKNILIFKKFIERENSIYSFQSKLGNVLSFNNNEILNDDKFSLGGRWLRGFDLYGAGPRKSRTSYIGAKNLMAIKLDYSRPITLNSDNPAYFNIFNDYGLLWDNKTKPKYSDNDLRSSYGFGIKYYSPIGPIGLSWGFPIMEKDYDIKRMFLFSIGNID